MAPTKKQRQIFEALLFLINERGENPTVREVGELVGLSSSATVMKHLRALQRDGMISLTGKSRGIRLVEEASQSGRASSGRASSGRASSGIPVLGRIAAGRPVEAVPLAAEHEAPVLAMDAGLFAGSGELMALRVSGESMTGAGILDGDHVIIRRQPLVEEGEIAAVEIDGEVTLKRWHRQKTLSDQKKQPYSEQKQPPIQLIAANASFDPIEIAADDRKEVRVLGKYVGLVRGEFGLL